MNVQLRKIGPVIVVLLGISLLAASCSSEDTSSAALDSTTTTEATGASTTNAVIFGSSAQSVTLEMPSVAKTLYKIGKDNSRTYGANQLVGSATVLGQPATVEILGSVDYTNGSGPFTGFLTVTWADASSIAFSILGTATQLADGSSTISSAMDYLGGSGTYVSSLVQGKFTASRSAQVGATIITELTLEVLS